VKYSQNLVGHLVNQRYEYELNKIMDYYFHLCLLYLCTYEGWNFNSGNYLFTTDTK